MIPKIHQEVTYLVKPEDRIVIAFIAVHYCIGGIVYTLSPSRGIARCHPGDEWDESIGKRLAESRAIQKAMKKLKSYLKYKLRGYYEEISILIGLTDKADRILSKEVDHEVSIKEGI